MLNIVSYIKAGRKKVLAAIIAAFISGSYLGYNAFNYIYPHWTRSDEPLSKINVCFTPGQNCELLIVNAIYAATNKILVHSYSFTSKPIADALIKQYRKGIEIKVLYEPQQKPRSSQIERMSKAGIEVTPDILKGIAHNKVIIIDDRYVITGSYNFTYAAQNMNAENVLLINDATTVEFYTKNWQFRYLRAKYL